TASIRWKRNSSSPCSKQPPPRKNVANADNHPAAVISRSPCLVIEFSSQPHSLPLRRRILPVGTWLSLVEHSLGVRGVGSSNLPVPTNHQFRPLGLDPAYPLSPFEPLLNRVGPLW